MYRATDDDRGTVQDLARHLDLVREDDGIGFQLGPRFEKITIPPDIYAAILQTLQLRPATVSLHSYLSLPPSRESRALYSQGFFFDHVIVNNRRYLASSRSVSATSSLVAVRVSSVAGAQPWVGELFAIIAVKQDDLQIPTQTFGYVRWFRPSATNISGMVWEEL
ncbi:hypothetical protein C8R46DRAFT_1114746 [Mycena filopes]|nr:hypothetical protein C8R46DRAFT_1114746 [Mycena filopes]